MPIYAIIDDSQPAIVTSIGEGPEGLSGSFVDITNANPPPQIGWTYDGTTFTEPKEVQNKATLITRAANALTANQTYLALNPPTQAQAIAQVNALTVQMNALIRLVTNQLSSTT